jgi:hypothetical protein
MSLNSNTTYLKIIIEYSSCKTYNSSNQSQCIECSTGFLLINDSWCCFPCPSGFFNDSSIINKCICS